MQSAAFTQQAVSALKPSLKTVSERGIWPPNGRSRRVASPAQPTHPSCAPACLQRAARSRSAVQVKAVASVEQTAAAATAVRSSSSRRRHPPRAASACAGIPRGLSFGFLQACCRPNAAAGAWIPAHAPSLLPPCCHQPPYHRRQLPTAAPHPAHLVTLPCSPRMRPSCCAHCAARMWSAPPCG
jgi:hypothetical protein